MCSDLSVFSVCFVFPLSVFWIFSEYSLSVLLECFECALIWVFPRYAFFLVCADLCILWVCFDLSIHWACVLSLLCLFSECALNVLWVCSECSLIWVFSRYALCFWVCSDLLSVLLECSEYAQRGPWVSSSCICSIPVFPSSLTPLQNKICYKNWVTKCCISSNPTLRKNRTKMEPLNVLSVPPPLFRKKIKNQTKI